MLRIDFGSNYKQNAQGAFLRANAQLFCKKVDKKLLGIKRNF
jgi:hypothetical protein